jgi:ribosomal protein L29
MAIKIMRKEIARILTVIRERELAVLEGAGAEEA